MDTYDLKQPSQIFFSDFDKLDVERIPLKYDCASAVSKKTWVCREYADFKYSRGEVGPLCCCTVD